MSPEPSAPRWDAVHGALRAVHEESAGAAEAEVLLRISRGISVRRARGAPSESSAWSEESVAVRVLLPDGGEGVAAAASWEEADEVARRAVSLAARASIDERRDAAEYDGGEGGSAGETAGARAGDGASAPRLHAPDGCAPSRADLVASRPQPEAELLASVAELERAALGEDDRVVALDAALARSAVVDSYLASTAGLALHQRHATAAAHAAVLARDGMSVAVRGDAWAGPRFTHDEATRLGRRLGRAGLVHLIGSGAAPPQPAAALLSASAVAEMTLPFVGALLGLSSAVSAAGAGTLRLDGLAPSLALTEDACDDEIARALPVDGAGRLLRRVPIIAGGSWTPPGPRGLPLVRPGSGDAPRPGSLRLSWTWDGGVPDDELLRHLGTGLWIESAHAIATDPATLSWRGAVAGFWVEDGRRRHAVAGIPFSTTLPVLLRNVVAGGDEPEIAHASGSLRAVPLVVLLPRAV